VILLEKEGNKFYFYYLTRTIPGEHIPKKKYNHDLVIGKIAPSNNTKVRALGIELRVPATTSSSVIGEFSYQTKAPKRLELKEKIFNDFFKAFVVKPQTKANNSNQVQSDQETIEAEYSNLKSVYNQSRINFQSNVKSNDYDNFYHQNESNYWSKNLEKTLPNSQVLQELSRNVLLSFYFIN